MGDGERQTSSLGGAFPSSAGVKPRRNDGMADSSITARQPERPVVWEGRGREASPYPESSPGGFQRGKGLLYALYTAGVLPAPRWPSWLAC